MNIALTGGIGSGKSTALNYLKSQGYFTLSADAIYKELCENEQFILKISEITGVPPIKTENGLKLDRGGTSSVVFKDKSVLKALNSFTHPRVFDEAFKRAKGQEIAVIEVPLLFEGGYEKLFDKVIVILRKDEERFSSASVRDGKSVEKIREVAKNQFDYSKIKQSEKVVIIENDGDEKSLNSKVVRVIENFKTR